MPKQLNYEMLPWQVGLGDVGMHFSYSDVVGALVASWAITCVLKDCHAINGHWVVLCVISADSSPHHTATHVDMQLMVELVTASLSIHQGEGCEINTYSLKLMN